ncbi:CdaR family protein [Acidobacteria bacterium AH-259-D05]|nr:CdaR family protein [Acidobacteria bacterium AH-259-D05]
MNILRELIFNNLELKAVSLLLAVFLWLQIGGQQTVQRTLSLPVEFVNIPSQMEISSDYEKEVEVVVRSRNTTNFDERVLAIVIDLKGVQPGVERSFPLSAQNIQNKPYDVDVLDFSPARIRLRLENTLRKIIEVTPKLIGQPAEGFEVTDVGAPPVMINGSQTRVENVSEAQTEPIYIEGLSSSLVQQVSVDIDDRGLRIEPASISVVVTIEEKRKEVRMRRIPVQLLPEDSQAPLVTRWVEIIGTVPLSFTGELKTGDFQVTVDVQTLEPQEEPYELIPQITVSESYTDVFRVESVVPERVKVRIIR